MNTARRAALTATLATTAALTLSGVAWGIGTPTTGQGATGSPSALTATAAEDTDTGPGMGRRAGPGRAGRSAAAAQGTEACPEDGTGAGPARGSGRGPGNGTGPAARGGTGGGPGSGDHTEIPDAIPGATVTEDVAEQLLYLVEEEKLAGDVYALAESLYGDRVFVNIGRAEDHHADEVRVLLDRYGLQDPTSDAGPGQFTDPELQTLYNTLSDQVRSDRSAAVEAGILIERTDIADLEELAATDLPDDVRAVVGNLLAGSERHLAAFQRQA